jgi:hypothetical protein
MIGNRHRLKKDALSLGLKAFLETGERDRCVRG